MNNSADQAFFQFQLMMQQLCATMNACQPFNIKINRYFWSQVGLKEMGATTYTWSVRDDLKESSRFTHRWVPITTQAAGYGQRHGVVPSRESKESWQTWSWYQVPVGISMRSLPSLTTVVTAPGISAQPTIAAITGVVLHYVSIAVVSYSAECFIHLGQLKYTGKCISMYVKFLDCMRMMLLQTPMVKMTSWIGEMIRAGLFHWYGGVADLYHLFVWSYACISLPRLSKYLPRSLDVDCMRLGLSYRWRSFLTTWTKIPK